MILQILSVFCRKGTVHDFRILKESCLEINRKTGKLADAGYQGISKVYPNSLNPVKRTKHKPLSAEKRMFNGVLSRRRIVVEHVNHYANQPQDIQRAMSKAGQELLVL